MKEVDDKGLRSEVWSSFTEQQHVFLATTQGDQPRVRPVTLIYLGGRLYVATGTRDAKVEQMTRNPRTEFCLLIEKGDKKGSLRAECTARVVEDQQVKANVFEKIPFMKEFFKTPKDPTYALIELQPKSFEHMRPDSLEAVRIKP